MKLMINLHHQIVIKIKKINSISCPSCNELFGKNFITSGVDHENFRCFKCSKEKNSNYYMCKICNGIFCTICPQIRYKHYAKCPLCKEKPGNKFIASGLEKKYSLVSDVEVTIIWKKIIIIVKIVTLFFVLNVHIEEINKIFNFKKKFNINYSNYYKSWYEKLNFWKVVWFIIFF